MKSNEFVKLKNSLALKSAFKIVAYSVICFFILVFFCDVFFNDILADYISNFDRGFYLWCISNKEFLLIVAFLIIIGVVSFFIIRKLNNNLVEIISAMDEILKNPENQIKLSYNLVILENRINNLRVDLLTSKIEADEANKKKDDLIMYMAHDLKTPLTSIIGYLSLLIEDKNLPSDLQDKYLNIVLKKSLRVEDLINQFFDITRYNLKSMPINKQQIDLAFLLNQLVEEAYPMLQENNLSCELNIPNSILFMGDGDKLARAFGNLLKNAISYSYKNSTIFISAEMFENKVVIIFKNTGDKIPDYKLDKLFDKFYRGDSSRASNTGGAGLGLAITKEIIELHNGSISVSNDDDFIVFRVELFFEN